MRALLLSTSGRGEILGFLGPVHRLGFVTAANLHDEVAYFEAARAALATSAPGLELVHVRWDQAPLSALTRVEAVYMGGGNTYALLDRLRRSGLLDAIRERVHAGLPYVGASAGSNVAGPTILTTNDWNVVGLTTFEALGLVPFNINPHYLQVDPAMAPGSETRDQRIGEYHRVRANPVLGLEEGSMVRVEDGIATILGTTRGRLFRRGQDPLWLSPGERVPL